MKAPRSYLFVPGDRPDRFANALASAADAVVVDLEDAVPAAAKPAAREAVAGLLADERSRDRIVVRINDEATPWFDADLALVAEHDAGVVMLPKAERVATIARIRSNAPSAVVLPLVETARGVLAADALAAAEGVQRLVFGTVDYALDMDLQGELAASLGLDYPAARLALASRAAGLLPPVAGVTVAIADEAQLRADVERARAHGFAAKLCIHPKQVAAVHALLAPSADELAWAERVLAAADAAFGAAVQLDGRMVDKPVIERARRIVQRAH
ncbi:HpcH/HpaI aldolase/citrate lyase family protein [Piscinibacter koreensis]|uniref:HpcH/HpaI aldolase/citrate lyase family protein n=1 Tax=Piscinibacter koreensis TaxID=2742824 RepID=A0A7Y6NRR0_9BURK|nr:aldolase/citrate lyase family protein [Schlegelella koreensis]NUZ08100.1 HpcH/HpaI aldolase/citrate lyase family protein [Schlegelella koreensis]